MCVRRLLLSILALGLSSATTGCFILYQSVPDIQFEMASEVEDQALEVTSISRGQSKALNEDAVSVWVPGDATVRFRVSDAEHVSEFDGFIRASTGLKGPHWSFDEVRLLDGSLWLPIYKDAPQPKMEIIGYHASPDLFLAASFPCVGWWAPAEADVKSATIGKSGASRTVTVGDGIRCDGVGGASVVLNREYALDDGYIRLSAPLGSRCRLRNAGGLEIVDFEFRTRKEIEWSSSDFSIEWIAPDSEERLVKVVVPEAVAIGAISFSSIATSERHLEARR